MRRPAPLARSLPAALATLALAAVPLAAQRAPRAGAPLVPALEVTPYAGAMRFGTLVDGPLGSSIGGSVVPMGGAQLAVRLAPGLKLVGNVAHARGDLRAGIPVIGGVDIGSSSAWMYDAGLELSLGTAVSRVSPFLQAGGGAISRRIASGPAAVERTNAAFNVGGGIDVALGRSTGLRLGVRDYIGRFDAGSVGNLRLRGDVSHDLALTAGLRLGF